MLQTQRLGEILEGLFRKYGYDKKILEYKAMFLWSSMVGEKFAPYAQPNSISDGNMVVVVSDSVRLTELNLLKLKLINRLNEELDSDVVKDIEFKLGNVPEPKRFSHLNTDDIIDNANLGDIELEREMLERIEQVVAGVEDKELKDVLRRFFTSHGKLLKLKDSINPKTKTSP